MASSFLALALVASAFALRAASVSGSQLFPQLLQ
jgi:hypothetical protein